MNKPINTTEPENRHESTYALLIHSEEKSRNVLEMVINSLLILGPLIAFWQFAEQPVNIPVIGLKGARCAICDGRAHKVSGNAFHALSGYQHQEING